MQSKLKSRGGVLIQTRKGRKGENTGRVGKNLEFRCP